MHSGYGEMNSLAAAESSAAAEQRWLVEHTPLVRRAVAQLASQAGGAMDREDMLQIGLMGLLEALRRYGEPDERFPGYAAQRVRGAILDELRRQDWRPRSVRQEGHRLRDGIRELRRRLGHEPSEAEVMQHLGVSAEDYLAYEQHTNAETLASFGGYLCLDADSGQQAAGIEINANHLRAVTSGIVTGTARPVYLGKTTQVWEIRIEDERGRLACLSLMTAAVIRL